MTPRILQGKKDSYIILGRMNNGCGKNSVALGTTTSKKVFVKEPFIDGQQSFDYYYREMFVLENVRHPNLTALYDSDADGDYFLAMHHLEGQDVGDLLDDEEVLKPVVCAGILSQVCDGLSALHDAGFIHRDVKPSNVFLTNGRAVLIDFGLSYHPEIAHLDNDAVFGTPCYISPEQIFGREVTPASDVYSLGIMLYEMLVGKLPFNAKDTWTTLVQQVHAQLPNPSLENPAVPEKLSAVIFRATAKNLQSRIQTAQDFKNALLAAVSEVAKKYSACAPAF